MGFAVEFHETTFAYPGRRLAVDGVTCALLEGTATAVFGLNGAGKSTLLQLAAGLLRPVRGRVLVFGANPRGSHARPRLFWLGDESPAFDRLRIDEVVRFFLALYARPALGRKAREEWLLRFGLEGLGKRPFSALSHGQRRRADLMLLALVDPDLWLLDEPHAALDAAGQDLLVRELSAARERGRTLVWASHAPRDLGMRLDHILVLRTGAVLWQGSPRDAMRLLPTQVWTLRGVSATNEGPVRAGVESVGVEVAATAPDPEAWLGFLLRSGGG